MDSGGLAVDGPSHPGFVLVQQHLRILERDMQQAFGILNNLPGMQEYPSLRTEVHHLNQRVNLAESHVQALTSRVGVTHHTHPQFKHKTPSAHLEGQLTEMKKAAPPVVSAEEVEAFMEELMHA